MKYIRISILMILLIAVNMHSHASQTEDNGHIKREILHKVKSADVGDGEKMQLYIDLFDLENGYKTGKEYLDNSLEMAIKLKNNQYIFEILDIHCKYSTTDKQVDYYVDMARKHIDSRYKNYCITWLKAYSIVNRLDNASTADEGAKELEMYNKKRIDANDKYAALQREMVIASAMECVSYFFPEQSRYNERIAHLNNVLNSTDKLPFFISYKFRWYYLTRIEYIYRCLDKAEPSLQALHEMEDIYKEKFRTEFYRNRKYMTKKCLEDCLNGVYSEMLYFGEYLGEKEIERIYSQMVKFFNDKRLNCDAASFRGSTYLYYKNIKKYDKALETINEIIGETDSTDINRKSELLAKKIDLITLAKSNYEQGFYAFWDYTNLMDRKKSEQTNKQLIEMQTRYNLDKIKLEKAQMESHYQVIALITAMVVSVAFLIVIIVQYILVVRLKRTKKELMRSNAMVAEESERAKAGESAKTEFIRSICHEIRTPLNAICGFSRLMVSPDSTMEEKEAFPPIIEENSNYLTSLLDDILVVADLGSISDKLHCEVCDVDQIITRLTDTFKDVKAGRVKVEFVNKSPGVEFCTNSLFLERMLRNLIDNSMKFTNKGSVTIVKEIKDDKLEMSIIDTGIGIPADKLDYIFEKFTKLNLFTSGTGLGLYICKSVIDKMGGRIGVDLSYTGGTKIDLIVPYDRG